MDPEQLIAQAQAGDPAALAQIQAQTSNRAARIVTRAGTTNTEERSIKATIATETPVMEMDWDRWEMVPRILLAEGMEVPEQVPFLDAHKRWSVASVLGSCRDFAREESVIAASIFFGRTAAATDAFGLMADGHLTDVSVGFEVLEQTYIQEKTTATVRGKSYTGPCYIATRWKLNELSAVPIGADPNAKLRAALAEYIRSKSTAILPTTQQERSKMSDTTTAPGTAGELTPETIRAQSQEAERGRITEIDAMCSKHNVPAELRAKMISDGTTIEAARGLVLDWQLERGDKKKPAASLGDGFSPDLERRQKESYSILRAVRAAISGNWREAGLELEVSNDISKRMGRGATDGADVGFFMPTNIPFYARAADYSVGTPGAGTTGGTLVATSLLAGSFIELLRNEAMVLRMGATMLSGLVGAVDIPKQTGAASATWIAEGGALSQSGGTFGKISLNMKTLGALSLITRNMLMQSTPDIEMLVRADLIRMMALAIDSAALYGTGASNQPRGIANQSGVGSVIGGTNGAAIGIDHLIDMETECADANVPADNMAYMANARTVGALKKLKSTTGQYLWTANPNGRREGTPGEINGYPVVRTNQCRKNLTKGTAAGVCSELYFGAWQELLIGEWGIVEIIPNPHHPDAYETGGLYLRIMQSLDVGVRHAEAFTVMSDVLTTG